LTYFLKLLTVSIKSGLGLCLVLGLTLPYSCAPNANKNRELTGEFHSAPLDDRVLVFYDLADPPTLDPARSWGFFDGRLIGLIFSNLVRFDHQARIVHDLATDWRIHENGTEIQFNLNPNATFSNGRKVDSHDVKYSFERILHPHTVSPSKWIFDKLDRITIHDPHSLSIHLKEPFAPFLQMLAMPAASIVPQEEVERRESTNTPFGENPVGSGPWLFKEWQHDQHLLFERNEAYWRDKPQSRFLQFRIISNPFTAIAEFETGNTALIEPLPIAEILRWRSHQNWKSHLVKTPLLQTDMLVFNCEKPHFQSEEVRRALCMALEPQLILDCVREGAGVAATGPVPVGIPGHTPNQAPFPFNPDHAKEICKKHGLDQKELMLLLPSIEGFIRTTGEVLQADWKKIGLKIRIRQTEWVTYRRLLREGDYDIALRTWWADYPDGDNFMFPLFHSSQIGTGNFSRFHDAEIDRLIEESQREMNTEKRERLLQSLDDRIYHAAPAVFLWHRANYTVTQPWLHNYQVPRVFNGTQYIHETIAPPKQEHPS
jgi:oligopeptide transport system substrate-binding protein